IPFRRKRLKKANGAAGPAYSAPAQTDAPQAVLTGQNAALKEAPPSDGDGADPNHPLKANVRIIDRHKALVETTRKKFAICGFASSTRPLIPVDDPEWEI